MNVRSSDTALWLLGGALWLALVSIASLLPVDGPQFAGAPTDKLMHLIVYAAIGAWFAAHPEGRWFALLAIGVGLELEWLQSLTEFRAAEGLDFLADALGVGLGFLVAHPVWRHFRLDWSS